VAPLVVLLVVTLAVRLAGVLGVRPARSWLVALRGGVAAMFVLTGVSHFVGMRAELIEMVPAGLPAPGLLVTVSGVLELLGAAGVLWRRTAPLAAGCLAVLLLALFPANVHAALAGLSDAPEDALLPRTLMQLVFLAATIAIPLAHLRRRRAATG
jgi:uncharacterized membrane protein